MSLDRNVTYVSGPTLLITNLAFMAAIAATVGLQVITAYVGLLARVLHTRQQIQDRST